VSATVKQEKLSMNW